MRVTRHRAADVDRELYLRALNACFPGWGGEERFAWCFERVVAGVAPDLLLLRDGETLIAGSAITYRMLQLADGARVRAGIMTGSWTLPEARGRGAFSCVIEESQAIATERDAPLLLAFVTAENPSRRRLETAGALAIPTFYCRLPPAHRASLPAAAPSSIRFVYSEQEWQSQFIHRPGPIECIDETTWSAVIERAGNVDRVLYLSGDRDAAIAALSARGRDLFCFSTSEPSGFDVTPGFFMILGADPGRVWEIQNGDRM